MVPDSTRKNGESSNFKHVSASRVSVNVGLTGFQIGFTQVHNIIDGHTSDDIHHVAKAFQLFLRKKYFTNVFASKFLKIAYQSVSLIVLENKRRAMDISYSFLYKFSKS